MGKHITEVVRYHIYELKCQGQSNKQIAQAIGVHSSTISREFSRNAGNDDCWKPTQASVLATQRRKNSSKNNQHLADEHWAPVSQMLKLHYSPEQISGRLKREQGWSISTEYIYQYIYQDKRNGGSLHKYLRCRKERRKRYGSGKECRGIIKNRVSIDERPSIVTDKDRMGDWEGDTIIGKGHQGAIVTVVERKSLYLAAAPVKGKHAAGVRDVVIEQLLRHKEHCHTITFDNGKEFAFHEEIAASLEADIYFAHPYHSWERGCNENINGLLRQYFPKNQSLSAVSAEQVQAAVDELNHRPRKSLGFKSPYETFAQFKPLQVK